MFGEMQNLPIVIADQPIPTPVPSVEIATKYNLMEETFGENWAKEPADKYLAPSYCTIGKLNQKWGIDFLKHSAVIRF